MAQPRKYPGDYTAFVKRLHEGAYDSKLAEEFGLCRKTIGKLRKEMGIRSPHGHPSQVEKQIMVRMHGEGVSYREIARQMGVHHATVVKAVRDSK